jgi:hypothetical protein
MKFTFTPKQNKILQQAGTLLVVCVWIGLFQACMPPQQEMAVALPVSPWGGNYAYQYDIPASMPRKPAGTVPVVIAVVNPEYRVKESALDSEIYSKVGKGFSASMGTDLDKILLAKGLTTTGPFPSLDEITYSDKKGAALTLAPQIFITADVKYLDNCADGQNTDCAPVTNYGQFRSGHQFKMVVSGWISFVMQEPLSGEKMWIKKLDLDPVEIHGIDVFETVPVYSNVSDGCGGTNQVITGYQKVNNLVYDGKADAMAFAIQKMYPIMLGQFQKYVDTDELQELKRKTAEIRAAKVY